MKRIIGALLGIAAIGILIFQVYLSVESVNTRPTQPNERLGRIYPHNEHGTIVYLTKQEDERLTWLDVLGVGLAVSSGYILRDIYRVRR